MLQRMAKLKLGLHSLSGEFVIIIIIACLLLAPMHAVINNENCTVEVVNK